MADFKDHITHMECQNHDTTWTQTSSISFDVHWQWNFNPFAILPESRTRPPTHSL